jgi:NADPH-dependent glutamate synthase beta subunit-like oxidoreductase
VSVYDINRIALPDVPSEFSDDRRDAHFVPAPCQVACPVGTDAPSYIGYIWEGKHDEAFEAITATNPFSSICGRVCDAPCEPACRRTSSDGAVQIRNLKRFVMDKLGATWAPTAVEVTRRETVAIVGSGPAGLVAAHDLAVAGFEVHVYEMTDRLGGMMVWGIPAFRLPVNIIEEDIARLQKKCPGIKVHLNTGLGRDISLEKLKERHDAVLLTIGSWWGKAMNIPGENDERVLDGVGFLRKVNDGERPPMPETVVVVGGGDVAMDACRAAKRLPGCKEVKVVYRRGEDEIPARAIELHHAVKEDIEFVYNTMQVGIETRGNSMVLKCVRTEPGEPDADGRRRPVVVPGSEHDIDCGLIIAAVGQQGLCEDTGTQSLMGSDRVNTEWSSMRTADPKVFAAGDGAFGGSTIVMAMSHGQRAAYYIRSVLDGHDAPMPYQTPFRTRRVEVAQDIMWERFPLQEPEFLGLGKDPSKFPEIEVTYNAETAKAEAARCYRCDAETGSADYAVTHREDIFSMARTNPADQAKRQSMLTRRMRLRDDPFPEGRPASLDDIVFLPANLSRLVIDPYREACRIDTDIGGRLDFEQPFMGAGFDTAPAQIRDAVCKGLAASGGAYLGSQQPGHNASWFQLVSVKNPANAAANAVVYPYAGVKGTTPSRATPEQLLGLSVSDTAHVKECIDAAFDLKCEFIVLDGSGALGDHWCELTGAPDLGIIRDTIAYLRTTGREEMVDLIYFGGARSGTDAAKLIGLGAKVIVYGIPLAIAAGGIIRGDTVDFAADRTEGETAEAVSNLLKASAGEASMMARCTGKTRLHNIEPEDLRSVTLSAAESTGLELTGTRG